MTKKVDFYFDFGSPTSYLAYTQLTLMAERNNAELIFFFFFLGGICKATGNSPPAAVPAIGMYMMADLH